MWIKEEKKKKKILFFWEWVLGKLDVLVFLGVGLDFVFAVRICSEGTFVI